MALMVATAHGFSAVALRTRTTKLSTTSLDLFGDALKGAFANDDTLGKRKNDGLTGGPDYNENVTVNGQKVNGAVVGQKLTVVAGRARVKIPVNCQKGDCGTSFFLAPARMKRSIFCMFRLDEVFCFEFSHSFCPFFYTNTISFRYLHGEPQWTKSQGLHHNFAKGKG
jgi:hypothetical protein